MSDYQLLADYLSSQPARQIVLTFEQLARILGRDRLPPSAYKYRQWWANSRSHSHAHSWLDAGWETGPVDFGSQSVTFTRR